MAKLTGPLMSLGATGQLGKALVFMTWKGINDVRQYVIPANPDTVDQGIQRDILKAAVDEWHLSKYTSSDKSAWNKYAAILAKPMSGFNAFVKSWIDLVIEFACAPNPGWGGSISTDGVGFFVVYVNEDGAAGSVFCDWGYSKTAMNTRQAMSEIGATNEWQGLHIAATSGKTVYCRFVINAATYLGHTGIYEKAIL